MAAWTRHSLQFITRGLLCSVRCATKANGRFVNQNSNCNISPRKLSNGRCSYLSTFGPTQYSKYFHILQYRQNGFNAHRGPYSTSEAIQSTPQTTQSNTQTTKCTNLTNTSNPTENNTQTTQHPHYLYFHPSTSTSTRESVASSFEVVEGFVSEEEEGVLMKELEPHLSRQHYEHDHWDDAIHGFRETERSRWSKASSAILSRVHQAAFPDPANRISQTHVLDLAASGFIKPHVDSVRFCGDTICGLCLLGDAVMRLVNTADHTQVVDVRLNRHSLYIMRGASRYDFTHAVLADEESFFGDTRVPRGRRVSVICRNHPRRQDA